MLWFSVTCSDNFVPPNAGSESRYLERKRSRAHAALALEERAEHAAELDRDDLDLAQRVTSSMSNVVPSRSFTRSTRTAPRSRAPRTL